MDEGLIFWLIIFAVAILQGIGQKRKKPGQGGRGRGDRRETPGGARRRPSSPSPGEEEAAVGTSPASSRDAGKPEEGRDESSEGMIPADVWEEILGLARGKPTRAEAPEPPPAQEEVGFEAAPDPVPAPAPTPAPAPEPRARAVPAVLEEPGEERSEAGAGTDLVLAGPTLGTPGARMGSPVRRELFGDGSPAELQKAMVLREVLGPPVGLREE